jgi:hypothetical protein
MEEATIEPCEPRIHADPKLSIPVHGERLEAVGRKPVGAGEHLDMTIAVPNQPPVQRADPQTAQAILGQIDRLSRRYTVPDADRLDTLPIQSRDPIPGCHPKITIAGLEDAVDSILRKPLFCRPTRGDEQIWRIDLRPNRCDAHPRHEEYSRECGPGPGQTSTLPSRTHREAQPPGLRLRACLPRGKAISAHQPHETNPISTRQAFQLGKPKVRHFRYRSMQRWTPSRPGVHTCGLHSAIGAKSANRRGRSGRNRAKAHDDARHSQEHRPRGMAR